MILRPLIRNQPGRLIEGSRFAVGFPGGPRSNIWRIAGDKSGIYLKAFLRDKSDGFKISIHPASEKHPTGICLVALESGFFNKLTGDKPPSRVLASWREPHRMLCDPAHICTINFWPEYFTKEPASVGGKIVWLDYPPVVGEAVQVQIFRVPLVGMLRLRGIPLGTWRFRNGDLYAVTATSVRFDRRRSADEEILKSLWVVRQLHPDVKPRMRAYPIIGPREFVDVADAPDRLVTIVTGASPGSISVATPTEGATTPPAAQTPVQPRN